MPSRNEQITANRVAAGAPTDCERERWLATISIRSPDRRHVLDLRGGQLHHLEPVHEPRADRVTARVAVARQPREAAVEHQLPVRVKGLGDRARVLGAEAGEGLSDDVCTVGDRFRICHTHTQIF